MAFRPEIEAKIEEEANRAPAVAWEAFSDATLSNITVRNDQGFEHTFVGGLKESGITMENYAKIFIHDTLDEIDRRRALKAKPIAMAMRAPLQPTPPPAPGVEEKPVEAIEPAKPTEIVEHSNRRIYLAAAIVALAGLVVAAASWMGWF